MNLRLRRSGWLWALPLLFMALFFYLPLAAILRQSVSTPGVGAAPLNWQAVLRPLGFTVWQAALSTVLTLLVGLPAAYLFARFQFPGKALLRTLTAIPFILPTVVVAAGFNALIGPRGWLNLGLMQLFGLESPPIQLLNTLWAILLAHIFYNTTIVIRLVGSALASLDPRLVMAARVLGASPATALRQITLPLLRPSILAAALLVFLFDFSSFGVILLLGGPRFATLEVEIYTQAVSLLNLRTAAVLSLVQLLCTLALTIFAARLGSKTIPQNPRPAAENLRRAHTFTEKAFVALMVILVVLLLVSPLLALTARSITRLEPARAGQASFTPGITLEYYRELFINRRGSLFYVPPIQAGVNSLVYGLITVALALLLGFPAAYALARKDTLARLLDPLLMLPLGTSAVTLGLGFILVFNRPPLDIRSFPLLVPFAHTLVALPFVIRSLLPAVSSIPPSLRHAAAALGAPPARIWREIDLPIISRAALAAAIFAFTISLGEFGATALLARPETPTLPVAVYRFLSQPGALNYGQALAAGTLLMLLCAASLALIEQIQERTAW